METASRPAGSNATDRTAKSTRATRAVLPSIEQMTRKLGGNEQASHFLSRLNSARATLYDPAGGFVEIDRKCASNRSRTLMRGANVQSPPARVPRRTSPLSATEMNEPSSRN